MRTRVGTGDRDCEASSVVRECGAGDVLAIQRILAEAPEAAYWSLQAIEDVLRQAWVMALVREECGEITGFVAGRRVMDEAEILNIAVGKKWRRRGDGNALMGEMLKEFRRLEVRRVFLEVRESNLEAIKFYEGLGFVQVGRREGYYRDPVEGALVLEKKLEIHSTGTE